MRLIQLVSLKIYDSRGREEGSFFSLATNQGIEQLQETRYVNENVIGDPNFEGLVLGCIEADFRNQILVGKLLTRSIRLIVLCTATLARFQQFLVKLSCKICI